jgi:hypothetical protein
MKNINFSEENIKLFKEKNEKINSYNIKFDYNYISNNIYCFINKINFIKRFSLILLFILLIYLLYIDYLYFIYNKNFNENELYINHNNETCLKLKFVKKFNSFIKLCKKSKLKNAYKDKLSKKPLISVIMPIYNGGKYFYYSL